MNAIDIINKTKRKIQLTEDEIKFLVNGYTSGEIPDYQMSAWLMAVCLNGLTEEETAYYRRGKNAHSHAAPKSSTPQEYAKATGLETLFGALYLAGKTGRLNELFYLMVN